MDDEAIPAEHSRAAPMTRGGVTLLLAGTGAAVGFVLGTAILAFLQIWAPGGFHWGIDIPFGMMFGGTFGALVGGVGAPLLGWLFLRTVPLGRAIGWSAIATLTGASIGTLVGYPVLGGCLGFGLGALILWATHRVPPA